MQGKVTKIVEPNVGKAPPKNHRVIVVSKDFRCLGYLDANGLWREAARNEELKEVIGWCEISDPG